MRRDHLFVAFLTMVISLSLATTAFAAIKFKGGFKPSGTDNGLTLSMTVALSGLANADAVAVVSVVADPTATCGNPGTNQTQAPGQNPAPVTVTGATAVPASSVKNGNATITLTTSPPTSPISGAPDCPNNKWIEAITDMAFVSPATIKYGIDANNSGVLDPSEVLFTGTCSFTPSPSTNGALAVSCP